MMSVYQLWLVTIAPMLGYSLFVSSLIKHHVIQCRRRLVMDCACVMILA